jgi:hypothetical protein
MNFKNRILNIFNNMLNIFYDYGLFHTVKYPKIKKLINSIKVHDLGYKLLRMGPNGDGGYLVPDVLDTITTCLSPGVGRLHGFEKDLSKRGIKIYMADKTVDRPNLPNENYRFIKKNIGTYEDQETITLDAWINSCEIKNNTLLQMDIEGSEYEAINSISENNLNKINVMIIEFHHFEQVFTKLGYLVINNSLKKILKYFDVAHVHPNNCCGSYKIKELIIPSTLELTFLNKKLTLKKENINSIPNKLDYKNIENKPDIFLDKNWY